MITAMASLRFSTRKDGTPYIQVLYRHRGKQTSQSFFDEEGAVQFRDRINQLGVDRALALLRAEQGSSTDMTVHEWLDYYIAHLTGVDEGTVIKYRAYVRNDIAPRLGTIPLGALSDTDIARWVQWMQEYGCLDRTGKRGPAKPKTIKNKHGFLSGALAGAVRAGHIVANPTVGRRLPQDEANEIDDETVFLSAPSSRSCSRRSASTGVRWWSSWWRRAAGGARPRRCAPPT